MENITAIIVDLQNAEYDSHNRGISINDGGKITIGIEEYEVALEKIEEERRKVRGGWNDLSVDLNKKSYELQQQHDQRIANESERKWTAKEAYYDAETKEKKTGTHAYVSYLANFAKAKEEYNNGVKNIEKVLAALDKDKAELNEKFSKVVWALHIIHKRGSSSTLKANKSLGEGKKTINIKTKDFLQGGGMIWAQPFFKDNKTAKRNGSLGLYIRMLSTTKEVLGFDWAGVDDQGNTVKIDQALKTGSSVQLHIYTQGLYGQSLKINLKANGKLLKANTYDGVKVSSEGKPTTSNKESKGEDFYAEVDVHDISGPQSLKPSTEYIGGHLIKREAEENIKSTAKAILNVQKAVLNLRIDPDWSKIDASKPSEETINIVFDVFTAGQKFHFDQPLKVKYKQISEKDMPAVSNQAVYVDNIETNFEEFHHCGYDRFIIKTDDRDINLIEDKSIQGLDSFELIAGENDNFKKVTIETDMDTSECLYKGKENDHTDNALALIDFPEKDVTKNSVINDSDFTSTSQWGITYSISGENDNNHYKTKIKDLTRPGLQKGEETDSKLVFSARYLYDYKPITLPIINYNVDPIFKYIWPSDKMRQTYLIEANSCRKGKIVKKIYTYPDISWAIKLSYNNSKTGKKFGSVPAYLKDTDYDFPKGFKQGWLKVPGTEKYFGLSLGAKWDNKNEFDLSADLTKHFQSLMAQFGELGSFVERVFLGKENATNGTTENKNAKKEQEAKNVQKALAESSYDHEARAKKLEQEDKELRTNKRNIKKQLSKLQKAKKKLSEANTEKDKESAYKDLQDAQKEIHELEDGKLKLYKTKGILRPTFSLEVIWPEMELELGWRRENIIERGPFYNQTGMVLRGAFGFTPLIGLEAKVDFLGLVQRSHPIALAVIAIVDKGLELLGQENKIVCELSATGKLGGEIDGFLNLKSGANTFNQEDRSSNKEDIGQLTGNLGFKLLIQIKLQIEKKVTFIIVTLKGELKVKAELSATAEWTGKAPFNADEKGWYVEPQTTFQGLEIKGEVSGELSIEAKGADLEAGVGGKGSKSFKWQAVEKQEAKKFGRKYFIKSNE